MKAIGECKLCGNLILLVDAEYGTAIAQAIPGYTEQVDGIFQTMEGLAAEAGSAEIMAMLQEYRAEVQLLEDRMRSDSLCAVSTVSSDSCRGSCRRFRRNLFI